ncbi:hypothetical protein KGQ64_04240 [bacterium]|nr:hypothetical protein [bacterium]
MMKDRATPAAAGRLALVAVLATGCMLFAGPAAARESGFQAKGAYALVSKDVSGQRWAMTYDLESSAITGNVFPTDGGPPKFVVCDVVGTDAQGSVTADCSGADACTSCPCGNGFSLIGQVTLPGSFFESCDGSQGPAEEEETAFAGTPGGSGPATAAQVRESGFQWKGDYDLVSKDVSGERWAMTYDLASGVITGNVFPQDGGAPKFVVCDVRAIGGQGEVTADCSGADACTSCPCSAGWTGLGTVTLPGSFFESCDDGPVPTPTPTPSPGGDSVTCTSTVTVVEAISYDGTTIPDMSGVTIELGYPGSLSIPGIGSDPSVADRISNLTGVSNGLFQVADDDSRVSVGLVSLATPIPQGEFASVRFDCAPGTTVSTSQFTCSTVGSNSLGLEVTVGCGIALTSP